MSAHSVQVIITDGIIPSVIASTPPHLLTPEQRKKPVEVKEMLIDIGADDREDAKKIGVEPGDAILPVCPSTPMASEKKIRAKAREKRKDRGIYTELTTQM